MDRGVCNDERLPSSELLALGWWRAARGSTAQLLLVGQPLAKWVFLWPEAKTMLKMLAPQVNHLRGGRGAGHTADGCLWWHYWRTLSCCFLREMFAVFPSPCYKIDCRGPTALQHSEQEQAGLNLRNMPNEKTDRWTGWNYLKGSYREAGVRLFTGKDWGRTDTF